MSQSHISKTYLFKLSIPIFFSNIAIPLVGIVDTSLMGHLSSEIYLAAMSIGTSVITMIFWSFGFLRMGTVGLVAQALGSKNYNDIALTVCRNMIAVILISIFIILLKAPILFLIQSSFNTSFATQSLIKEYVSVRLYSAPAELSIYVLVGLYLGLQKTKISSLLITFFCLSNIILSMIFVIYLDLEIFGVALGTLISAYLTVGISILGSFYYFKKNFNIQISFKKIINRKKIFDLFKINFDIFIRTVLLTFSFLWITYLSSGLGENYLAVNVILLQFIMLASFILDSYAFSTEALVGFSIGKQIKKNFLQVVSNSFQLSIITGLVISLIYLISSKFIISMLTDLDYLKYLSYEFILWIVIVPPIASLCYQLDGIFIGASQTKEMRDSMILSFFLFISSSNFLISKFGNHGLWMCLLFFMVMRSVTLNYHFNKILKKF